MIYVKNLTKRYGEKTVYKNFSLDIEEGKTTCILGESGCGKTTLLNVLAGLTDFSGEVSHPSVSYVFQTPRLIPNLTVEKNIAVSCTDDETILKILKRVGLENEVKSYPKSLSGGQKQRVSLCRALLKKSDILLMDEPFSSLDIKTKLSVATYFRTMIEEYGRTCLFVTHDIDEALFMADRIIVLTDGGVIRADFKNEKLSSFASSSPLRPALISSLLEAPQ